jgi:hypothetical protein
LPQLCNLINARKQIEFPLVIDDVEVCASLLSPLGRDLLLPLTLQVHQEIIREFRAEKWPIVSYNAFIDWASKLRNETAVWLVVDKLFPTQSIHAPAVKVDMHRSYVHLASDVNELKLETEMLDRHIGVGMPVVILDDATYTGSTLRCILAAVKRAGGSVERIVVCVGRPAVAEECWAETVAFSCQHLTRNGQDILHFRDFFPWLPFSGRRIGGRSDLACKDDRLLSCRLAPITYQNGAWLHLSPDKKMHGVLLWARREFFSIMDKYFHGRACVEDLLRLGIGVGVPLSQPGQMVSQNTPLAELLKA